MSSRKKSFGWLGKLFARNNGEASTGLPPEGEKGFPGAFASHEAIERYEDLTANLLARYVRDKTRYARDKVRTIMFTSCALEDGVTTTAVNFAAALSRDPNNKVLLLGANLRSPNVHTLMGQQVENKEESQLALKSNQMRSLLDLAAINSEVLDATKSEMFSLAKIEHQNFCVLPCGDWRSRPVNVFGSQQFTQFMEIMQERFDYVIVDAPPVQGFPETLLLASKVDGVVLVVNSGKTRRQAAIRAKKKLVETGGRLLGVVLNKRKYYIPDFIYQRL